MSYFVVERSGDGGGLRIPLPTAYETREAAIAALSSATGSGEVTLTGEVFIADLGSAVPVLVMTAVAPAAPIEPPAEAPAPEVSEVEAADEEGFEEPVGAEAPELDSELPEPVEETPTAPGDFIIEDAEVDTEPAVLDEESADEVYTAWEPIDEVAVGGSTLADALKRATTTLEDEGIVAPDSVLAEPGATEVRVDDIADSDGALGEPPLSEIEDAEEASEWPWANIDSYEVPADVLEDVSIDDAGPTPIVAEPAGVAPPEDMVEAPAESLGEDAPIITSAPPEGEEVYVPRPVILGDYADASPEPEPVDVTEPERMDMDTVTDLEPDVPADTAAEAAEDEPTISFDAGYALTGELDLGEYTCQDCVYSNTCPKVGQVTPAECGSFQWKSE